MATSLSKTPCNNQVQQLQQQYVPRRPSPLAKYSFFGKKADGNDDDDSSGEENDDDNDSNGEENDENENSGKFIVKNGKDNIIDYHETLIPLVSSPHQTSFNTESASSINNENRNTQIKTVYPVLQKSYSISNNNLLDKENVLNDNILNNNSFDSETTTSQRPTIKLSPSISYGATYISTDLSDSTGDASRSGSISTSVSGISNLSTLNGIIDENNIQNYSNNQYEEIIPIPMFVHGDHVLIFSSESMKEMTIKYGITGQLSGTLPLAPQQNSLLGFPWRLSLYEVLWCLDEKIGILIDSKDVIKEGYVKEFMFDDNKRNILINDLQERLNIWRDEKQKEIEEQMKKLNIIKKAKKSMQPLENGLVSSASMPDLQQVLNDKEKKEREIEESKRQTREMNEKSKKNKIVFMETPSDDSRVSFLWDKLIDKYYQDTNHYIYKLLKNMINNEIEKMHYMNKELCYEKLWMNYMMFKYLKSNLGYSLLPGMRFGGVFVSYPGDPLRYHSQQIIETREYYKEDIGLFKICNRGRLATGVRKVWVVGGCVDDYDGKQDIVRHILENQNEDNNNSDKIKNNRIRRRYKGNNNVDANKLRCFSIEWAGF